MKYISIDIETTGLNRWRCQILQIASNKSVLKKLVRYTRESMKTFINDKGDI